jgi:hypothetical protein
MCWSLFSSMIRWYGVKEWEHLVSKVRQLSTHSNNMGSNSDGYGVIRLRYPGAKPVIFSTLAGQISALCFFSLALRILAFHNLAWTTTTRPTVDVYGVTSGHKSIRAEFYLDSRYPVFEKNSPCHCILDFHTKISNPVSFTFADRVADHSNIGPSSWYLLIDTRCGQGSKSSYTKHGSSPIHWRAVFASTFENVLGTPFLIEWHASCVCLRKRGWLRYTVHRLATRVDFFAYIELVCAGWSTKVLSHSTCTVSSQGSSVMTLSKRAQRRLCKSDNSAQLLNPRRTPYHTKT